MSILGQVREVIHIITGIAKLEINLEDRMEDDLSMSDMDIDEVITELEDIYGFDFGRIFDKDQHRTVRHICRLVKNYS